ncbi:hypothetical protein EGW08_008492, partial [Elysia chlorotica]
MEFTEMSGQGYKRTNFEEDDYASNGGTPPPADFTHSVDFRGTAGGVRGLRLGLPSWKHRTTQEKVLLVLLAALALVVIILSGVMALTDAKVKELEMLNKKFCMTPECVNIASTMLTAMDRSVDPCEDFYTYACGGWVKNNPIPPGHSRWGTFDLMTQKNMLVMKNALDKPDGEFKSTAELKSKHYYLSCMDEDKLIEKAGGQPLLDLLAGLHWGLTIPAWGDSADWALPQDWSLDSRMEDLHLLSIGVFFSVYVAEDAKNSSANILQVDQSGLGLPDRNYYLNKTISEDKVLSAYLTYMTDVFTLLGAPNKTIIRSKMEDVILFETELANITTPNEDRRDERKMYHKMTLANLTRNFPRIKWLHLVNHLLSKVNLSVSPTEPVVVLAPEYLTALDALLTRYLDTEEGTRILNDYMLCHLVMDFASTLSKPFREAKRAFSEVMTGTKGNEDAWFNCISDTDSVLGFAVGALFVRETFKKGSKEEAQEMIENVRTAFTDNLPNLDWMDDATRAAALDKANAVTDMIGYPDYILDNQKLDNKYEDLKINKSNYFYNILEFTRYGFKKSYEKLRQVPLNEWAMSPSTVNAYYTPSKNTIVFPAGILQAPFYDRNFPKSLNYGAMGVVMGHELTHGFDDQGREYDKNGNMKNWWGADAVERFKKKTQCMIDQYDAYTLRGEHEHGKQTLGENIADNGGLKSAYNAYSNWVEKNGEEQLLPALNLNHRQLFFLSFAQVWCWNSKAESD